MKNTVSRIVSIGLLGIAMAFACGSSWAEGGPASNSDTVATAKASRGSRYPIRGKLKSVDAAGQTFTLSGSDKERVFRVDSSTVMTRNGKPAALSDASIGEQVGGLVEKQADGVPLALKVRFGAKTDEEMKATTPRKTKKSQ